VFFQLLKVFYVKIISITQNTYQLYFSYKIQITFVKATKYKNTKYFKCITNTYFKLPVLVFQKLQLMFPLVFQSLCTTFYQVSFVFGTMCMKYVQTIFLRNIYVRFNLCARALEHT